LAYQEGHKDIKIS